MKQQYRSDFHPQDLPDPAETIDPCAIAIIGMSGRFPGASNLEEFWQNLQGGVESVSQFSDEELLSEGLDPALVQDPHYVKAGPVLSDIKGFDASFFGFSARAAELMDPQHRLFLECAWEVLESAGYNPETEDCSIGVYAGATPSSYLLNNLQPHYDLSGRHILDSPIGIQVMSSNGGDFLPTRVSYQFNLKGPSVNLQTACSTSLVAVHVACQSLQNGECDMALAGGVSVLVPHKAGYLYQQGTILSPDGHCRAFDARAQGTIFGDGVGIMLLKRLEDAIADRDCIHAIIKGSAINNDGHLKASYTAPSVEGQAAAIAEAQEVAGVDPETISYIEAHGTGTALGDPIEIAALNQVFRESTEKTGFCAIGSVKTNFGHLWAASGIAGSIKTVLALKHKQLPPSLHFQEPNPQIDFESSPFFVNTQLSPWQRNGTPRRAGVSSFGFGGTNAHIVLEEAPSLEELPQTSPSVPDRSAQLFVLSAKTATALDRATANLANHLQQHPELNPADVAYTLSVGRKGFAYRRMLVASTIEDAASKLSSIAADRKTDPSSGKTATRSVVFMFSGQGSQYPNMARDLYEGEPVFRQQLDLCCDLLEPHLGFDLRQVLYPRPEEMETAAEQLKQTAITQPALFAIEYALARLWMAWGIQPVATIGHSIGEYVAAAIAGVFSLEDALSLVSARGQFMQSMPSGSMLAVPLPESEVQPLLGPSVQVAVVNSPSNCVVSGTTEAIEALQQQLAARGVECRRLRTSHAFHSSMMEPMLEAFVERVRQIDLQPPSIPYVSNVTGTWIDAAEATDPTYWAQHLRQTVRFAQGLEALVCDPDRILLEVGPGRTLSTFAKQHPDRPTEQIVLTSIRHPKEKHSDVAFLLDTVGQLWTNGVEVNWSAFYDGQQRYRLPLPTYPFEHQQYWLEPGQPVFRGTNGQLDGRSSTPNGASSTNGTGGSNSGHSTPQVPSNPKKSDLTEYFYIPTWKPVPLSTLNGPVAQSSPILVFGDRYGLSDALVKQLELEGLEVVSASVGSRFAKSQERRYTLNPEKPEDYEALLEDLKTEKLYPRTIVHAWSVMPSDRTGANLDGIDRTQTLGFFSLLFLAQALGKQPTMDKLRVEVVTNNMQQVAQETVLHPEQATVLGPCKVIPREYAHITCRNLDVELPQPGTPALSKLIEQIRGELAIEPSDSPSDSMVAYRGPQRWMQTFEPVSLPPTDGEMPRLKPQGVYLITGGLGGIGLTLAEYLAQAVQAKLILTSRSTFPEMECWEQWLHEHDDGDATSCKIRKLQSLCSDGAQIEIVRADVTDREQMQAAIAPLVKRFGQINGILHCAGVPGGGVVQRKTPELAESVLAAKVKGTLVLETLFEGTKLDFFFLCSSLSSVLSQFGQVDYCGANAFLDAFARYKTAKDGTFTVSANWDSWQEVGMAVEAAKPTPRTPPPAPQTQDASHPLFDRISIQGSQVIGISHFKALTHWVLDEHRVLGRPTLPGTAYLELARSVFAATQGDGPLEMRDVYFLAPLAIDGEGTSEVRTILTQNGNEFEFEIVSRSDSNSAKWQQHSVGKIARLTASNSASRDLQDLFSLCPEKIQNPKLKETAIEFGPRWDNLQQLQFGKDCGIARLDLPEAFTSDLETHQLHPALMDVATSFLGLKYPGEYLPFAYGKIKIYEMLPARFYSHMKFIESPKSQAKNLKFNITFVDECSTVILEIEDYLVRRI